MHQSQETILQQKLWKKEQIQKQENKFKKKRGKHKHHPSAKNCYECRRKPKRNKGIKPFYGYCLDANGKSKHKKLQQLDKNGNCYWCDFNQKRKELRLLKKQNKSFKVFSIDQVSEDREISQNPKGNFLKKQKHFCGSQQKTSKNVLRAESSRSFLDHTLRAQKVNLYNRKEQFQLTIDSDKVEQNNENKLQKSQSLYIQQKLQKKQKDDGKEDSIFFSDMEEGTQQQIQSNRIEFKSKGSIIGKVQKGKKVVQCFKCNKLGHYANKCKQKKYQPTCYRCYKKGHYKPQCPYNVKELDKILKETWFPNKCRICSQNWWCIHRQKKKAWQGRSGYSKTSGYDDAYNAPYEGIRYK